jgi:hypothetical protein
MAEIKGVTLKGLTRFVGMEGEAYQGNIYLNGKKVGWYSQDGNGGCSDIRYDSQDIRDKINAIVKEYFEEHPPEIDWANTNEFFFEELVNLILDEKDFKKAVKKGYAWYMVAKKVFDPNAVSCPVPIAYSIPQKLTTEEAMNELISELKLKGYNKFTIYKTSDDFIIK